MAWNLSDDFILAWGGDGTNDGSFVELLANGYIELYSGTRPAAGADAAVTGTLLCKITLNGDAFTPGTATNGINLGEWDGLTLKRAIDSVTSNTEIWRGIGLAAAGTGTAAGYARYYANAASTTIRMDGVVASSGGDLTMRNGTTIVEDVNAEVSDVSFTFTST